MSGGIVYVLDEAAQFGDRCNTAALDLEPLTEREDIELIRGLLERHEQLTGSRVAKRLLKTWRASVQRFVKVMPEEYRRALREQRLELVS
jgi:glutamate synthase domain-containing protein 3